MSALAGRVAVVTGASRGIGLAVASRLEQEGARVVRASRSLAPAETGSRLDVPCDVSDAAQVTHLAAEARRVFGTPSLVVSNAGAFLLADLEATSPDQFSAQLSANLAGPFLVARTFIPLMRSAGGGRLVHIGSVADHRGFPGNAAYAASKYGLRGLHEVLREEFRNSGVLCTLVSPGPTDTAAWDPFDPDHRQGMTPRSRMLMPDDVAEAVAWIASRAAHIDVDWIRMGPA